MTEKRFYIQCDDYNAWSVWEKNKDVIVFDLSQPDALIICNKLNGLSDENEQLKQRNTNQYNQLNHLWRLIEAKDWETLIAMDNQMKEDEKRLRNEWKCYE